MTSYKFQKMLRWTRCWLQSSSKKWSRSIVVNFVNSSNTSLVAMMLCRRTLSWKWATSTDLERRLKSRRKSSRFAMRIWAVTQQIRTCRAQKAKISSRKRRRTNWLKWKDVPQLSRSSSRYQMRRSTPSSNYSYRVSRMASSSHLRSLHTTNTSWTRWTWVTRTARRTRSSIPWSTQLFSIRDWHSCHLHHILMPSWSLLNRKITLNLLTAREMIMIMRPKCSSTQMKSSTSPWSWQKSSRSVSVKLLVSTTWHRKIKANIVHASLSINSESYPFDRRFVDRATCTFKICRSLKGTDCSRSRTRTWRRSVTMSETTKSRSYQVSWVQSSKAALTRTTKVPTSSRTRKSRWRSSKRA